MSELLSISEQTKEMLEAILFAAGHPVTYDKLSQVFEISPREVKDMVEEYAEEYNNGKVTRGIMLLTFEDNCQLCTKEARCQSTSIMEHYDKEDIDDVIKKNLPVLRERDQHHAYKE